MPGRRGTEKRALTALVNIRTTATMRAALEVEAEKRGLTAIALARQILADALPAVDPAEAVPVAARVPAFAPPPAIVHELAAAREAAAEACGMLVQAARRYRETGQTEQHTEAERTLTIMRRAAGEMLDLSADISSQWRAFLASRDARP